MRAKNPARRIRLALMSTADFEDRDLGTRIVRFLLALPAPFRPTRFDTCEPIARPVTSVDAIVDLLVNEGAPRTGPRSGSLLLQADKTIGYDVFWRKTQRPGFSLVGGGIDDIQDETILATWIDHMRSLVEIVSPAYGEIKSVPVTHGTPLNLQIRLPEVPPISIYGKDYVELFGRDKIETAPFLEMSKIGACYWLVAHHAVTEDVPEAKRAEIRDHFGADAFMPDGRWKMRDGRAPSFDLSNSLV
jgi:hypothetical protein